MCSKSARAVFSLILFITHHLIVMAHRIMEHGVIDRTLLYEQREIEEFEKEHGGVGSVEMPK